MDLVK